MPLVRIAHASGKPAPFAAALGRGVHDALVEVFGIPTNDYFQIITEHAAGTGIVGPEEFLGIRHSPELVIVQVACAERRGTEQKKALYKAIVGNLARDAGVPAADVIINLVETRRENWSFGNGEAPFA